MTPELSVSCSVPGDGPVDEGVGLGGLIVLFWWIVPGATIFFLTRWRGRGRWVG